MCVVNGCLNSTIQSVNFNTNGGWTPIGNCLNSTIQSVNIEYCPICSFQICKDNDIVKYLMKINNITKNEILEEIKNKFGTYEEFKKFIEDEE